MIREVLPYVLDDGVAVIDFRGDDRTERYHLLLVNTIRLAFGAGARRVEVTICAADSPRRRALHRAGLRLEGVLRERLLTPDGPSDLLSYARLASDRVDGPEGFTGVMNTVTPRKRLISHMLLTDDAGRVCVLETTFKPDFELPGGILNVGETPRQGLVREVQEELSHAVSVGRLLVVDWLAPYQAGRTRWKLIFDGREMPDASSRCCGDLREIRAVHWLEPDAAVARMAPFAQGRLRGALAAREEGRTLLGPVSESVEPKRPSQQPLSSSRGTTSPPTGP